MKFNIAPECPWKMMVGRLLSFWGKYIFRGYVKLPGGKYIIYMPPFLPRNQLPKLHATWDMAVRDCSWALLLGRVYVSTASISITCITIFKFTLVCFWVPSSSKQSWLSCFHQNFRFIKLPYPLSVIEESARCPGDVVFGISLGPSRRQISLLSQNGHHGQLLPETIEQLYHWTGCEDVPSKPL